MLGTTFNQLSNFVIFVVLARLLAPKDFGLVAFAAIFVEMSLQFLSAGLPDLLVKSPDWDQKRASTALWMTVGASAALCLICVVAGTPLLDGGAYAGIGPIFAVLSVTLLIDSARQVLDAKLRREFAYRAMTIRQIIAIMVAGVVGIALAASGAGPWALVANRVVVASLSFILTLAVVRWVPSFTFSMEHARKFLHASLSMTGAQVMIVLNGQVAPIIIGALLGPAPLAIYRTGNNLITLVTQLSVVPFRTVALSTLARMGDQQAFANAFQRMTSLCCLIAFPAFLGAGALAPDLVAAMLGARWADAGPVMAIASLCAVTFALDYLLTPTLTAAGHPNYSFYYFTAALIGNIVFALAAAPFGLLAVAASQVLRAYLLLPLELYYLKRAIGIRMLAMLENMAPALIAAAGMAGLLLLFRFTVFHAYKAPVAVLILVPAGGLIYLGLLALALRQRMLQYLDDLSAVMPVLNSIRARIRS